jgi:misacylated tRNA(Ala) deacylase
VTHTRRVFITPTVSATAHRSAVPLLDEVRPAIFPCGPVFVHPQTSTYNQITQASSILSCGAAQVPDQISQVVDERKSSEKRVTDLASQLVLIVAREFLPSATRAIEERALARVHRNNDPLVCLADIASEFVRLCTVSEYTSNQYFVVGPSSHASHTATSTTPVLVFGSDDVHVKEVGETLKLKLGVKRGGKSPR